MIKYGQYVLLPCLRKVFNLIMESGKYPKTWGVGYLVAIHKGDAISNPNNYRGIAINSCLGKVFNSILNNRLVEFLNVNSIMKENR